MLYTVFCGMCMGAADLVPGISGGTVAFIMGFYADLLNSIKSFSFKNASAKFLGSLISGILISFILLGSFFDYVLNHEVYRSYLYAGFLGLILASILLLLKEIKWQAPYLALFLLGAVSAFIFTVSDGVLKVSFSHSIGPFGLDPYLVFCGFLAVLALLLPGISGSYVLTILGCYQEVIGALADFTGGLKSFVFDSQAFMLLLSLGIGVLAGGAIFARGVSSLLKNYRAATMALMSGFMVGALPAIWPFWTYAKAVNPLRPEKGLRLKAEFAILPEFSASLLLCIALLVAGFSLVFFIQHLARKTKAII